jgi:hypothetical protein
MSDHGDHDRDDDESNVQLSRERRNSHNEDSGSSSSHLCKLMIIKISKLTYLLKQHRANDTKNQVLKSWQVLAKK